MKRRIGFSILIALVLAYLGWWVWLAGWIVLAIIGGILVLIVAGVWASEEKG